MEQRWSSSSDADGLSIRPACPSDAPAIAHLIAMAMTEPCCQHFYGPNHTQAEFVDLLTDLAARPDTQYSYRNALVACHKDAGVVGLALSYDGGQLHALRQPFIDEVLKRFGRDLTGMHDETQAGELYLDSFAVLPQWRNGGIGTRLLEATAQRATAMGQPCVGLLVDDANDHAFRLYQSVGFRQIDTSSWGGHAMKHLQRPTCAMAQTELGAAPSGSRG